MSHTNINPTLTVAYDKKRKGSQNLFRGNTEDPTTTVGSSMKLQPVVHVWLLSVCNITSGKVFLQQKPAALSNIIFVHTRIKLYRHDSQLKSSDQLHRYNNYQKKLHLSYNFWFQKRLTQTMIQLEMSFPKMMINFLTIFEIKIELVGSLPSTFDPYIKENINYISIVVLFTIN